MGLWEQNLGSGAAKRQVGHSPVQTGVACTGAAEVGWSWREGMPMGRRMGEEGLVSGMGLGEQNPVGRAVQLAWVSF